MSSSYFAHCAGILLNPRRYLLHNLIGLSIWRMWHIVYQREVLAHLHREPWLLIGSSCPATSDEGYSKVIHLTEKDRLEQLNAARVSLGVLGVISKVTLQLEPMFKRSISFQRKADEDLQDQILSFAFAHEFGDITWHPAQSKAIYRMDDRVPVDVPGDGVFDFCGFRSTNRVLLTTIRTAENLKEMTNNAEGKCLDGQLAVEAFEVTGHGLREKENAGFRGYPTIGYQHRADAGIGLLLENPGHGPTCMSLPARVCVCVKVDQEEE